LRADLRTIQLLGVEVQHATQPGRADAASTGRHGAAALRRGQRSHHPSPDWHRGKNPGNRGRQQGELRRPVLQGSGGEASWKTSDFEQAADRYEIDFARGVRDVVVDTLELEARGSQRLATVLFTDIVGSTEHARMLGDQRWRELLDRHDEATRRLVDQEGGRLIKRTGDGVLAVFDGPGRGIRCALALRAELRASGIEIRAGLHTGEVDLRSDDGGGIAVHIAARVMAAAAPGEVLVSRTVQELVVGSGITLEDRGTYTLKGLDHQWQLFGQLSGISVRTGLRAPHSYLAVSDVPR
jgi:class 3 adenylate cyclase